MIQKRSRGHAEHGLKGFGKITEVGVTNAQCSFRYIDFATLKQLHGGFQAVVAQIFKGRYTVNPGKTAV